MGVESGSNFSARGSSNLKRVAALAFALLIAAAFPVVANAAKPVRSCGTASYRTQDDVGAPIEVFERVYVRSGPISCARARKLVIAMDVKPYADYRGWNCRENPHYNANIGELEAVCKNRWSVVASRFGGNKDLSPPPPPPRPGHCQDVQGYAGEYAMNILAEAVGCHEAQQVAFGDMTTPACVSDCIINVSDGNGGTDQFECTPQGNPYGAYQDELCDAGYAKVPFTLVNGP